MGKAFKEMGTYGDWQTLEALIIGDADSTQKGSRTGQASERGMRRKAFHSCQRTCKENDLGIQSCRDLRAAAELLEV